MLCVAFAGCDDQNIGGTVELASEWALTSFCGSEPQFIVYIDFNEDGTYAMYQQVYTLNYELYTGDYSVYGDIISGTYDNGGPWSRSYTFAVVDNGDGVGTLTLTDTEDESFVCVYETTTIPEDVKVEASETRAEAVVPFL